MSRLRRLYGRWLCFWFTFRGGKIAGLLTGPTLVFDELQPGIHHIWSKMVVDPAIVFLAEQQQAEWERYCGAEDVMRGVPLRKVPGGVEPAEYDSEVGPVWK